MENSYLFSFISAYCWNHELNDLDYASITWYSPSNYHAENVSSSYIAFYDMLFFPQVRSFESLNIIISVGERRFPRFLFPPYLVGVAWTHLSLKVIYIRLVDLLVLVLALFSMVSLWFSIRSHDANEFWILMTIFNQVKVITLCQSRYNNGEDGNRSKHFLFVCFLPFRL